MSRKDLSDSRVESNSNRVTVPPRVYEQLAALEKADVVDMRIEVVIGLEYFGFNHALDWITANPDAYLAGIQRGFAPADPSQVDQIDPAALRNAVPEKPDLPTRNDADTPLQQYILDYLQGIHHLDPTAREYYLDGSWRTTAELSPSTEDLANTIDGAVGCEPNRAYHNALHAAASFGPAADRNISYVEGVVMDDDSMRPLRHAWIEVDQTVVELTLPSGPQR